MNINIKKLNQEAVIPAYAHTTDAGLDLTATSATYDENTSSWIYGTGLAIEIPEGYVGLLFPRSSIYKTDMQMTNCVGVIDSGYRGEIKAIFRGGYLARHYDIGDRIAQLIILPYPQVTLNEVSELSTTDRGTGGHGSTGR